METDEPPVGFLPSCNLLDSCSSGRMGRALALGTQTQTGIQTHRSLPFWFIIARAMTVALIWFLWSVGRETTLMVMIVLRRMSCLFAVSQDSIQRRVRMSVHNPPRLAILAAIGLLRDEPLAISTLEFLPTELYPPLFMAAIFGRHRQTLKAMVPAWPFARLPLGSLMQKPHQGTLQAVLEGLDVLLGQKVHPRWVRSREPGRVLDSWKRHMVPGRVDDQVVTRGFWKSSEAFSEELLRSLWEIPYKYIIGRMEEKKELGEREQERKETTAGESRTVK